MDFGWPILGVLDTSKVLFLAVETKSLVVPLRTDPAEANLRVYLGVERPLSTNNKQAGHFALGLTFIGP